MSLIIGLRGIILLFLVLNTNYYANAMDRPVPPASFFEDFKTNNKIDEFVIAVLKSRSFAPSETCSDEVFVRRVYLDSIGTLPTSQEVRVFLSTKDVNKREKLIDRLLSRNEFANYWTLKWGDLLRIKSEFPSNLWPNAVQAYSRWVHDCIQNNIPYNEFVKQLLTSSGSSFRNPPVNFYRAFQQRTPQLLAENVALVFMGIRLNDSGFEEDIIHGMEAFFTKVGYKNTEEWKEEIVYFNPDGKPLVTKEGKEILPMPLNGNPIDIPYDKDPRIVFADWLTASDNPWFAKNIVNRIWFWLMGRGIIHEPDDIRRDNLSWNEDILKYLEKELIENKYDLKHIYSLILNSNTYQLSSKPNNWNIEDEDGFSHYRIRRLDAEVLIDAICQITGTGENYSSLIPEPFTFLPWNQRAISIADGSITSPFLEMFGRSQRNTSFESERNSVPSVSQVQNFLNSSLIERKIEKGRFIQQLIASKKDNNFIIDELYLSILSRFPTDAEKKAIFDCFTPEKYKLNEAAYDLAWALMNTTEFIFKH